MILSQVRYPADSWIYTGVCGGVNVWVGALSTIPREHPGVNNLVLAYICILYICIFIYRLSAVRCTIMLVWARFLSTNYMLCLPREHLGVNNLVLAYTCSLYICIFIYRLSAVRCTIMLVWAGLLSSLSNVNDWVGALSTIPIEHLRVIST